MVSNRLREVEIDLDKAQQIERLKQLEATAYKEQCEKQKVKIDELETENFEIHSQMTQLKQEKNELERKIMLGIRDSMAQGSAEGNSSARDYEKTVLTQKMIELEAKIAKKRQKAKELDIENNFYHQTTTIFLTIKKIIEKEKQYCFLLAKTDSKETQKREEIMEGIKLCQKQTEKLDAKLRSVLINAKQNT